MGLLLDGGAELEKFLGNGLLGGSEDVDEAVCHEWLAWGCCKKKRKERRLTIQSGLCRAR